MRVVPTSRWAVESAGEITINSFRLNLLDVNGQWQKKTKSNITLIQTILR